MIWESVGKQRVRAHLPGRGNAGWNSHCLLPDRSRVGHFENPCSRVKKFSQVREMHVRAHMIGAEINLSRDSLAGFNFQRRLRIFTVERRYRLTLVSRYLEPEP